MRKTLELTTSATVDNTVNLLMTFAVIVSKTAFWEGCKNLDLKKVYTFLMFFFNF